MELRDVNLIVVRHSERLDEANESAWKRIVATHSGRKTFKNDPILSPVKGPKFAQEAAITIKKMLEVDRTGREIVIYSSRMLRAVQTASIICKELNLPLHLSGGLAHVIPAVKNCIGDFEFADVEEINQYCSGVDIVNCDDHRSPHYIPHRSWRNAVQTIVLRSPTVLNIIVGHRETVRKLAGAHLQTPYCCLGMFKVNREDLAGAPEGGDIQQEHPSLVAADAKEAFNTLSEIPTAQSRSTAILVTSTDTLSTAQAGGTNRLLRTCGSTCTQAPRKRNGPRALALAARNKNSSSKDEQGEKPSNQSGLSDLLSLIVVLDSTGNVVPQK